VRPQPKELHDLPLDPVLDEYLLDGKLPEKLFERARHTLSHVVGRVRPASWYVKDTIVDVRAASMELEHAGRLGVGRIARALQKGETVALFVCTLGPALDARQRELAAEGDPVALWLFDEISSFCVERAGDAMQEAVAQDFPGLRVSARFGPGYCGWDVSEQRGIFGAFDEAEIGVRLHEGSCMMTPRKSISGFFCLSDRDASEMDPCRLHDDEDCPWRRSPRTETITRRVRGTDATCVE
jgi:hypothetical protein